MFGKKDAISAVGLAEDTEDWIVEPTEPHPKKKVENVSVDPAVVNHIRDHFYQRINPEIATQLSREDLLMKIVQALTDIVDEEKIPLNWKEQSAVALDLLNDMTGIGPIQRLLEDDTISDILVNGPNNVFVERRGLLELTDYKFRDEQHLLSVARRIALSVGRRVDESSPMVDARLQDGSRVNIIIPPLSVQGTIVSIRKFPKIQTTLDDLVENASLSGPMARFLELAAASHLNILISGGTGAGKTTFLNALSEFISPDERVVTIEDAVEINLQQPHVISLETRQKNVEGTGEISQRDLLCNALRMRPDRIIIGEVRGPEAHEMLQAMNTGHDGSLSTIHANSPRDALVRLEDLILSYHANNYPMAVRRQIAAAVDLIVHVVRDFRGHRYVRSICEVTGLEGDVITLQELFYFEEVPHEDIMVFSGDFTQNPIRPHALKKARRYGLDTAMEKVFVS